MIIPRHAPIYKQKISIVRDGNGVRLLLCENVNFVIIGQTKVGHWQNLHFCALSLDSTTQLCHPHSTNCRLWWQKMFEILTYVWQISIFSKVLLTILNFLNF